MWIHKKRCTAETDGTVMNIQGKGSEAQSEQNVENEVKKKNIKSKKV